jgi:hypothetical protein
MDSREDDMKFMLTHYVLTRARQYYETYEFENLLGTAIGRFASKKDSSENNETLENNESLESNESIENIENKDFHCYSIDERVINLYPNYKQTDHRFESFLYKLYSLITSTSMFTTNLPRALIRRNLLLLYSQTFKFPDIKFFSPLFFDEFINSFFNDTTYDTSENNDFINSLAITLALIYRHQHYEQYFKHSPYDPKLSNNVTFIEKYPLTIIPRDLQAKLTKPSKYFAEIKSNLTFSNKTNYYCYEIDGNEVPVICKHEYMLYNEDPLDKIANECYQHGKCKFCNVDLVAYHEKPKEVLHPTSISIIYQFINCLNDHVDEIRLLNYISSLLSDELSEYHDINLSKEAAFTSIFLLKLYALTKPTVNYNSKINIFSARAKDNCASVGWTTQHIQKIIHDEEIFESLKEAPLIIKNFYPSNFYEKHPEMYIISTMFEDIHYLGDTLKPETKLQEIYLSGNIENFNRGVRDHTLQKYALTKLSLNGEVEGKDRRSYITITEDNSAKLFFERIWFNYCPVLGLHRFSKNQKKCDGCGINDDGSNVRETFQKYSTTISSLYSVSINTPQNIPITKHSKNVLKEIDSLEADPFPNMTILKEELLKEMINHDAEIINFLQTFLKINLSPGENTMDYILKVLTYLSKNNYSEELLYCEMINICFSVNNILKII